MIRDARIVWLRLRTQTKRVCFCNNKHSMHLRRHKSVVRFSVNRIFGCRISVCVAMIFRSIVYCRSTRRICCCFCKTRTHTHTTTKSASVPCEVAKRHEKMRKYASRLVAIPMRIDDLSRIAYICKTFRLEIEFYPLRIVLARVFK